MRKTKQICWVSCIFSGKEANFLELDTGSKFFWSIWVSISWHLFTNTVLKKKLVSIFWYEKGGFIVISLLFEVPSPLLKKKVPANYSKCYFPAKYTSAQNTDRNTDRSAPVTYRYRPDC